MLRRKGPRVLSVLWQTMGGTPGDHTQGEEKIETKFIVLGPPPKFLDPGTISKDLLPVKSSLDLSHHHPLLCVPKEEDSK